MFALIASAALLLAADAPPTASDTQADYQAAKAAAGRSPDDQVRLAYWCEAHGLSGERMRHLAQAVLADPNHAAARGLLGLVARADRWVRPDAVADQVKADPTLTATLAEYDAKRSAAPYTADGQWALATWAEEHGLGKQARAHFTAVVRLDPRRDAAWKKLGYKKHDGRWQTDAEVAAAKADAEAQKAADKKWKPLLERYKADLARPGKRAEAEAGLLAMTDPRAVPMVARVLGAREADGPLLVRLLGQIDAPTASRLLAHLAMFGPTADTRRAATETLRSRDPREFAGLLIPLIHKPIRYEIKPVNGPGSPGVLFVEGEKSNIQRLYEPKSLIRPNDRITVDRFGQPVVDRVVASASNSSRVDAYGLTTNHGIITAENATFSDLFSQQSSGFGFPGPNRQSPSLVAGWDKLTQPANGQPPSMAEAIKDLAPVAKGTSAQGKAPTAAMFAPENFAVEVKSEFSLAQVLAETRRSAEASQQQLNNDVAQVESQNRAINEMNDRVTSILNTTTGANLSADPTAWQNWWVNLHGYAQVAGQTEQNPTFVEVIPSDYQPEVLPSNVITRTFEANIADCFAAGTPVQTMTGPRAIETIKVGDMVLTQSTSTGALNYQPVTVTHRNPPASTFRVDLGGDRLMVSQFHRFWVARRGWVMARDLKAGDPIRTLGGVRSVDSVEAGQVELVYNLDIADDADFFAGASAALVHDNTLPDPRLVPFDLPTVEGKPVAAR